MSPQEQQLVDSLFRHIDQRATELGRPDPYDEQLVLQRAVHTPSALYHMARLLIEQQQRIVELREDLAEAQAAQDAAADRWTANQPAEYPVAQAVEYPVAVEQPGMTSGYPSSYPAASYPAPPSAPAAMYPPIANAPAFHEFTTGRQPAVDGSPGYQDYSLPGYPGAPAPAGYAEQQAPIGYAGQSFPDAYPGNTGYPNSYQGNASFPSNTGSDGYLDAEGYVAAESYSPPLPPASEPEGLSAADIRNVTFSKPPFGRRGYHEDEVDAFLDVAEEALDGKRALSSEHVRNVTFSRPPLGKRGYNEDEVDAFLDLVADTLDRRSAPWH